MCERLSKDGRDECESLELRTIIFNSFLFPEEPVSLLRCSGCYGVYSWINWNLESVDWFLFLTINVG